ncbi:hypothetical protein OZ411_23825 [Bradyrhizobium sp. Arg237L]|uniref:hypothetical protein n=1 Tax=Bradyrhizobium sp. Arg237L TaxID=3003352 RepID=UPI00249E8FFB|nr:hypothetical protein [Bradyrhizobium sp. Arg237L]MDI4235843.1 hypothetical protein [Bradyrhizobium sp. Arg237L]
MAGIEPNGLALALFAAAFAACCLSFFTLVGMFPRSARPQSIAGASGGVLVLANLALLMILLAGVASFAHQTLRWTSVVVFGGLIFLFIPAVFQVIPGAWRDSRSGLAVLGLVQLAALALMLSPLQGFTAS